MDLPLLKNDIPNILEPQKPVVYCSKTTGFEFTAGPSMDDYIRDPEYPAEAHLLRKIQSENTGLLFPKSSIFSRFGAKCRLDNRIFI